MKRKELIQAYKNIELVIDSLITRYGIQYVSSSDAPNTFRSMVDYYIEHGVFKVFDGGDHGYLGKEYNIKFRALHDFMHYYNGISFSFKDEKKLSDITVKLFMQTARELKISFTECFFIGEVIDAEISGQIEYYEKNKEYVTNQSNFIDTYLKVG